MEETSQNNISPFVCFLVGVVVGGLAMSYWGSDLKEKDLKAKDLSVASAYLKFKEIKSGTIPGGVPSVYGEELGVSFDKAQDAINKVAPFDLTYGKSKIGLTEDELKRYIKIGLKTACQYCCGATTLVQENGEAACGCEHSQMMRGLIAYLIKNHPEMPDEMILNEANKWKAVFFPKQTLTDKLAQLEKSGEPGIKELMEEFPDFLPQMVGGC